MAMKKWGRLDAAVSAAAPLATVVEVISLDAKLTPGKDVFHASVPFVDLSAQPNVVEGWTTDGKQFVAPAPAAPPSVPQLLARAQAAFQLTLAKGQIFNVAASGQPAVSILCDGTRSTRDDLVELAAFGKANASGTRVWLDNAGAGTMLTGAQLVTLDALVRAWASATYTAHATLLAAITAEPPTIATTAQVNAFAWPGA